jgi:predicted nucleic acid-binding protein
VKLVVVERESTGLMEFLRAWPDRASSALSLVEVPRALRRGGRGAPERQRARRLFARLAIIDVDRRVVAAAAGFDPPELRTLDAIHLATALVLGEELAGFVTYDRRLASAAARLDLVVHAPA